MGMEGKSLNYKLNLWYKRKKKSKLKPRLRMVEEGARKRLGRILITEKESKSLLDLKMHLISN